MKRIFACAFACLLLAGCVELAVVAGVVTAMGGAIQTAANAVPAVILARDAIKEEKGIVAKLRTFRNRYCAEADLRAQAADDLTLMLTGGGVDAQAAAVQIGRVQRIGRQFCGEKQP